MDQAQSPQIPEIGRRPGLRDLPWLMVFLLRGGAELVRARLIFAGLEAKAIPERNRRAKALAKRDSLVPEQTLARMAFVIPRISNRLPWRSDCVIQAIAGQNWLSALGAQSEIQIGVEDPKDGEFAAHAWLLHGESVVTGGDISQYHPILVDPGNDANSAKGKP